MGVTPGRVSQIENGDLDANEVATLSRYARALGARMRIICDYGTTFGRSPNRLTECSSGTSRVTWSNVPGAGHQ